MSIWLPTSRPATLQNMRYWGTGYWGTGALMVVLGMGACSSSNDLDPDPAVEEAPDPPEPCTSRWESSPLCSYAVDSGGDPGAGGMGGTTSAPDGDECWIASQASLSCPTKVSVLDVARSHEELDWLVGLVGVAGVIDGAFQDDMRAYLYSHRLGGGGEVVTELQSREGGIRPDWSLSLAGATEQHGSLLLAQSTRDAGGSELIISNLPSESAGEPLALSAGVDRLLRPDVMLDGSVSAALFLESRTEVSIVHNLADPVVIEPGHAPSQAALAPDADGNLLLLTEDTGTFRLYSGDSLEDEIGMWGGGSTTTPFYFDFRAVDGPGTTQGILLVGDDDAYLAKIDDSGSAPTASLERGPSTCDALTIGFTCDNCPDGTPCEVWTDHIKKGALIEREGRLYAVYVASEELSERQMTRHTNFTGIGCTCNPDEISSSIVATSLVVKEVLYQEGGLQTVVRMRTRLPADWQIGYTDIVRNADGDLDVVLGPSLFSYRETFRAFPEEPEIYRVLNVVAPE